MIAPGAIGDGRIVGVKTSAKRRRWGLRAALAAIAALAGPARALAQAADADGDPSALVAAATVGALAGMLVMAAIFAWRRSNALGEAAHSAREAWHAALAGSAREGYFAWGPGDPEGSCSPRLAELLGLDPASPHVFGEVAFRFRAEDAIQLGKAVETLRETGKGFLLQVATADGRLALDAAGLRVSGPDEAALGAVVWFGEARSGKAEIQALDAIADATSAERDRLQAVLDAAPFPAWQRDAQARLIWCNRAYGIYAGASVADVLAFGRELEPEGARGAAGLLAKRASEAGKAISERRTLIVGGEARAVELVETPVGASGETAGFARDVSELVDTQFDLDRHVASQAELLERIAIAIALFDGERRLVYHNDALAKLWRIDREWLSRGPMHGEILERLRIERQLPEQADFPAFKRARLAIHDGAEGDVEGVDHLPDGRAVAWLAFRTRQAGLAMTLTDVTERLALAREKATVDASLKIIVDNLGAGISVYRGDGRLGFFNSAFAAIWRLDAGWLETKPHVGELIESTKHMFGPIDDWSRRKAKRIATVVDFAPAERKISLVDGRVLHFRKVLLPDGSIMFSFTDVTDSENIAQALKDRAQALEAADRFKREFFANASYDLRTPLTSVIGFAELMQSQLYGSLSERQAGYARDIGQSATTLLDLIDDILDLASAELNDGFLDRRPVDLHELLSEALDARRELAEGRGIALDLDCPTAIGRVEVDERRLKRALDRILAFAIGRTPGGEPVVVGASREIAGLTLWIADAGEPLPPKEQAELFEPFSGVAMGSLRRPGGGVGLALAKRVVELHGGRVGVAKEAPRGLCIIMTLPV